MAIQPNAKTLLWALERSGYDSADAKKKWPKFEQWLDGSWNPTVNQIREFADFVHVSVPALFAESIPDLNLQIADFRTVGDSAEVYPTPELYDTVNQMLRRQSWLHEFFINEHYSAVDLIGTFADKPMSYKTAEMLANFLHEYLKLEDDWATKYRTVGDAFRALKQSVENAGIAVVVNGIVGDNTHRPLRIEEFRGFALCDDFAPLVFINGKDLKTAQMFTLIHELAHLAYSQTGVSNPSDEIDGKDSAIEKFCNRVAADFLVPTQWFLNEWEKGGKTRYQQIDSIAKKLKVNFVVVARKAKDIELIDENEFFALYTQYKSSIPESIKGGSGGDYYLTKQYRLGSVFSDAIWSAVNTGYIDYRAAYDLTGLSSDNFRKYFTEVGL